MKNKVTLRDIAREANVSVATVSYVLNNRNDQSISEATRKKILQIVNLYNYKLNFSAKSIASGKTNIIAMCLGKHDFALHKAEHMLAVERLSRYLFKRGYNLSIVYGEEVARLDWCDAIICCDTDSTFFANLAEANYCPLLAFNTRSENQDLFYQINTDYENVRRIADEIYKDKPYTVVSFPANSALLRDLLTATFPDVVFADSYRSLDKLANKNIVVLGETLGEYCKRFAKDILVIDTCSKDKIGKLFECFTFAVERKEGAPHDIRI